MTINWPILPGTLFPSGPPGTPGTQGPQGITGPIGVTGPPGAVPWTPPAPWASSTSYTTGPPASLVINAGQLYVCILSHISTGTFDGSKWQSILTLTAVNFQVPTTGFNITCTGSETDLVLDPAGTLASGTVTMCLNPYDGQYIRLYTSQTITAFTIAGNGKTVKGAPTTWAAPAPSYRGIFRATNNTWYF